MAAKPSRSTTPQLAGPNPPEHRPGGDFEGSKFRPNRGRGSNPQSPIQSKYQGPLSPSPPTQYPSIASGSSARVKEAISEHSLPLGAVIGEPHRESVNQMEPGTQQVLHHLQSLAFDLPTALDPIYRWSSTDISIINLLTPWAHHQRNQIDLGVNVIHLAKPGRKNAGTRR